MNRRANKYFFSWLNQLRFALLLLLFFVTIVTSLSAQTAISATLTADSTHILIGDHLNVKLAIKHPKSVKIYMPVAKDSIGNMEFISASKIDTIQEPTDEILAQTYTISAFDSGQFHAGPVPVFFKNSSGAIDTLLSNAVVVDVNTIPVDTMRPFKPIKGPLAVPYNWRDFLPYILATLLLLVLIIAAILLWQKFVKQKPIVPARPLPKDPAHIWARKELKKLEDEKLWQKGEIKLYYSRLTDILRLYLEYRFGWLALESTTEEIDNDIDNYKMKEKAKDNLLQILRAADLVKFAKQQPMPDANIKAMESAYKFIDLTEPKEDEEKQK
jgi:hypothetical protein